MLCPRTAAVNGTQR